MSAADVRSTAPTFCQTVLYLTRKKITGTTLGSDSSGTINIYGIYEPFMFLLLNDNIAGII